eukprot:7514291-Pyramimonas_sp.AAC.2
MVDGVSHVTTSMVDGVSHATTSMVDGVSHVTTSMVDGVSSVATDKSKKVSRSHSSKKLFDGLSTVATSMVDGVTTATTSMVDGVSTVATGVGKTLRSRSKILKRALTSQFGIAPADKTMVAVMQAEKEIDGQKLETLSSFDQRKWRAHRVMPSLVLPFIASHRERKSQLSPGGLFVIQWVGTVAS